MEEHDVLLRAVASGEGQLATLCSQLASVMQEIDELQEIIEDGKVKEEFGRAEMADLRERLFEINIKNLLLLKQADRVSKEMKPILLKG